MKYKIITIFIAGVWLINGLFAKVLNLVPRHEQIVARILGTTYSETLIILIGISEIIMTIWILSNYKTKLNAILQIVIIFTMNVLELSLTSDLLLWGKLNIVLALLFIVLIAFNNFKFNYRYV